MEEKNRVTVGVAQLEAAVEDATNAQPMSGE